MSIKSIIRDRNEPVNWERTIHKALHLSLWWIIYSFAYLFLLSYLGDFQANRVVGLMLGLYLLGLVVDTALGATYNDDNNPPDMSRLGRFLQQFKAKTEVQSAK